MQHIQTEITDEKLVFKLSIARISFLDFFQKKKLFKNLDSPYSLALLSIEEIFKFAECGTKSRAVWNGEENLRMANIEAIQSARLGVKIIFYDDEEYPEALRQIADPPFALFCRGNISLLGKQLVSVVGTRRLSPNGRVSAKQFAYDAVMNGCTVVSGLAYGADAAAHQGALDASYDLAEGRISLPEGMDLGSTIAVLPCGIDQVVPWNNKRLAASILEKGGLLVSEYGPGTEMGKWLFVARNRIVAGLSPAVVVIEAPAGSGALITADLALEYGRDVFFHESAFSTSAKAVSQISQARLEKEYSAKRISRYKMENTPEKFLSAGAPVIKDYKDYCVALEEMPGLRSVTPVQGELFT